VVPTLGVIKVASESRGLSWRPGLFGHITRARSCARTDLHRTWGHLGQRAGYWRGIDGDEDEFAEREGLSLISLGEVQKYSYGKDDEESSTTHKRTTTVHWV